MTRSLSFAAFAALTVLFAASVSPAQAARTQEELQKLVDESVTEDRVFDAEDMDVFGEDYPRALPLLLNWLNKRESFAAAPGGALCPAQRIFRLLKREDWPKGIKRVVFEGRSQERVRRKAAGSILGGCRLQEAEVVEVTRSLLGDSVAEVAEATFEALLKEIESSTQDADLAWAKPYFRALSTFKMGPAKLAPGFTRVFNICTARLMMKIDPVNAVRELNTPYMLSNSNPAVFEAIDALNDAHVVVCDVKAVRALYQSRTGRKAAKGGRDPMKEANVALRALAIASDPQAAKIIEERLNKPAPVRAGSPGELVLWRREQMATVPVFLDVHGWKVHVPDYLHRLCLQWPENFATLSEMQKAAVLAQRVAVALWKGEDPAASFVTYFENNPPSQYPATIEALRTVGAGGVATLFASAVKSLGTAVQAEDADVRKTALSGLNQPAKRALEKLVPEMIRTNSIDVQLLRFMLRNRKNFEDPPVEKLAALEKAENEQQAAEKPAAEKPDAK